MGIFDLFRTKNEDSCKEYLKELIKVAKADGHLEKREYDLILKIGQKLECPPSEVESLSQQIEIDHPSETQPTKNDRLRLIFDLVAIMMIDQSIDPKEMGLCKSIAMKSGFEPEVIDDIVHRIKVLTGDGMSIEQACNNAFEVYKRA